MKKLFLITSLIMLLNALVIMGTGDNSSNIEISYAEECLNVQGDETKDYIVCEDDSSNEIIQVFLDGKELEFDVNPVIINGRTLVPVRTIFEALGAEVIWDGEEKTVTAHRGPSTVVLWIDSINIYLNGVNQAIDARPIIKADRTLIPLCAVSEAFGCDVEWREDSKTVFITSNDCVEELQGLYRVNGRFYPETLPEGEFLIHFSDNFEGNEITYDSPERIKVSIGDLDPDLFYNCKTTKSYYVYVLIKDNGDGTYQIIDRERRLYLPEDE